MFWLPTRVILTYALSLPSLKLPPLRLVLQLPLSVLLQHRSVHRHQRQPLELARLEAVPLASLLLAVSFQLLHPLEGCLEEAPRRLLLEEVIMNCIMGCVTSPNWFLRSHNPYRF
jgi:hypothetical protein